MKLLLSPTFDSPVAPRVLDLRTELAPLLADYGIHVVEAPEHADLELVGIGASIDHSQRRLPIERAVLIDGEPPQPEYLLPHYTSDQARYAAMLTPGNLLAYAPDGMAFYEPPTRSAPRRKQKLDRVIQLATFRSRPGNANDGTHLVVQQQNRLYCHRVLCTLRASVGRSLHLLDPEFFHVYGRGWPSDVVVRENSRGGSDFVARRVQLAQDYGFDFCWENMEIPHYVSEKFWSALRAGILPIYWGPPEFHAHLPKDSILDARDYLEPLGGFDFLRLHRDLLEMSEAEYLRRLGTILDWYDSLDTDAAKRSWLESAHVLAQVLTSL